MSPKDDGSGEKFRPTQEVMILDMLANGERRDVCCRVNRYMHIGSAKGKVEVVCNTVYLYYDESKLVDAVEYWRIKNSKRKE